MHFRQDKSFSRKKYQKNNLLIHCIHCIIVLMYYIIQGAWSDGRDEAVGVSRLKLEHEFAFKWIFLKKKITH